MQTRCKTIGMKHITRAAISAILLTSLAGCGGGGGAGAGGTGGGVIYSTTCSDGSTKTSTISQADSAGMCPATTSTITTTTPVANYVSNDKLGVFNQLNADRLRCGFGSMVQNSKLDTAAQGHADYMALNSLDPTHTQTNGLPGFTGATTADRLAAAGYTYSIASEGLDRVDYGTWFTQNVGVFPQTAGPVAATNNLRKLYSTVYHLVGLMDGYREFGIGVAVKDNSGGGYTSFQKYMVVVKGTPSGQVNQKLASNAMASFPCEGVTGLDPYFGPEVPNPFPSIDMAVTPYGTPVYLMSAPGTTLQVTSSSITLRGGAQVATTQLTTNNDPLPGASLDRIGTNQVFVVPTAPLANNATYDVILIGTNTGLITGTNPTGAFVNSFSFQTSTYISN